jgi:hypothetical protein
VQAQEDGQWRSETDRGGSGTARPLSDDHHALLLETADYWLSLGLAIAVTEPDKGNELLSLIETEEGNRTELVADGEEFVRAAIG